MPQYRPDKLKLSNLEWYVFQEYVVQYFNLILAAAMYTVWQNDFENNYLHIVVCTSNYSHIVVY